ncbi:MAG: hypothetical protein HY075_07445 [Deltaproteobacteria bacterium]|nr:hypothetical protein [Deltaproteobacteria bacterium]
MSLLAILLTLQLPQPARAETPAFCPAPASAVFAPTALPSLNIFLGDYNISASAGCLDFAMAASAKGDTTLPLTVKELIDKGRACLKKNGLTTPLHALNRALNPDHSGTSGKTIKLACARKEGELLPVNDGEITATDIACSVGDPTQPEFPAIAVNMEWAGKFRKPSFQAAFFHELFHVAGYGHDVGVDYAYLAADCCFEKIDAANACAMMKNAEGKGQDYWTSKEYLAPYMKWQGWGRWGIAKLLLDNAAKAKPNDQLGVHAGTIALLKVWGGHLTPKWKAQLLAECLPAAKHSGTAKTAELEKECNDLR